MLWVGFGRLGIRFYCPPKLFEADTEDNSRLWGRHARDALALPWVSAGLLGSRAGNGMGPPRCSGAHPGSPAVPGTGGIIFLVHIIFLRNASPKRSWLAFDWGESGCGPEALEAAR